MQFNDKKRRQKMVNENNGIVGLVSIIVPIYNTEDFLDRCIESIVSQTYKELEVILLDDGSLDSSLEKCLAWAGLDERIIVIHKKNERQGPTRDRGVRIASGEYLMFVDSDDWVEKDYVELLYKSISSVKGDIAFCDLDYVALDQHGNNIHSTHMRKVQLEDAVSPKDMPEIIFSAECSLCNKIFRNRFWQAANIVQQPECGEDVCVCAALMPLAERISQVKKVLYHYCKNEASTTHQAGFEELLWHSLVIIKTEMERGDLKECFNYPIKKLASSIIPYNAYTTSIVQFKEKRNILKEKFERLFIQEKDMANVKSAVWGSFNLRCAVKEYTYFIPDTYSFSSLISLMSRSIFEIDVSHPSNFRREAIYKDICKEFLTEMKKYECIYIDFLEERYDIIEVGKDSYLTKSDAWNEADKDFTGEKIVIGNCTPEFWELWRRACDKFIQKLKLLKEDHNIILIKTRLSEWYGCDGKELLFSEGEVIKEKNKMIEKMEEHFLENYPEAIVLENVNQKILYSDTKFPYGCFPYHLNGYWNWEMGRTIRNTLESDQ